MPSKSHTHAKAGDPGAAAPGASVRVLKKYPNRRLYDTQSSSYITLADVKQMVLDAQRFEVRDAKDGSDLTRSILLQIILEEESGGVPMFSTETLAQIIRFYGRMLGGSAGAPMPTLMSNYFEQSQALFKQMQDQAGAMFPGFGSKK